MSLSIINNHEILNPGFRLVFRTEFLKIVVWHQYWGIPSSQIRESRAWSRGVSYAITMSSTDDNLRSVLAGLHCRIAVLADSWLLRRTRASRANSGIQRISMRLVCWLFVAGLRLAVYLLLVACCWTASLLFACCLLLWCVFILVCFYSYVFLSLCVFILVCFYPCVFLSSCFYILVANMLAVWWWC